MANSNDSSSNHSHEVELLNSKISRLEKLLETLTRSSNKPESKYLRTKDVCNILNISKEKFYNLTKSGVIPTVKIFKSMSVIRTDLEAIIQKEISRR